MFNYVFYIFAPLVLAGGIIYYYRLQVKMLKKQIEILEFRLKASINRAKNQAKFNNYTAKEIDEALAEDFRRE